MPYRAMALVAASLLFATQCYAATNLNASRSNIYRAGSTTSGGGAGAAKSTTVNSSKSNNFAWAAEVVARARPQRGKTQQ
jgi:hypothetical protein